MELEVVNIEALTEDCKAFYFAVPKGKIPFKAGQFLTFVLKINQEEIRRSYSICTAEETDPFIGVAVKRVKGGLVSNYLNDHINIGDKLKIEAPAGQFVYEPDKEVTPEVLLIAGGSGITPMLSIIKTALYQHPTKRLSLLYVNRSEADIIFYKALKQLEHQFPDRLKIVHYLNEAHKGSVIVEKKLFGLFNSKSFNKDGFITTAKAQEIITSFSLSNQTPVYLCGPIGLMNIMEESLQHMGFQQLRKEHFVSNLTPSNVKVPSNAIGKATITVRLNGKKQQFDVLKGQSILEGAVLSGIDLPHSCKQGNCTACYGVCTSGDVAMITDEALTDEELAEGGILACVGYPTTKKVSIKL
ncbi:ferredoxin--NADP reductase [Limibacter armeniacum]|uniref:ferredoxin--NADP reductase n=1 Tax=Limibacter armeniacum TaxID=466084 RepID=UPI002FE5AC90